MSDIFQSGMGRKILLPRRTNAGTIRGLVVLYLVAHMGEVRGAYNILGGRPEGRRPLGRHRRRWEDNIKMGLREIGFGDVDWIHLAQYRDRWRALVNTVMKLRVP
jgi:hypothetical protein